MSGSCSVSRAVLVSGRSGPLESEDACVRAGTCVQRWMRIGCEPGGVGRQVGSLGRSPLITRWANMGTAPWTPSRAPRSWQAHTCQTVTALPASVGNQPLSSRCESPKAPPESNEIDIRL